MKKILLGYIILLYPVLCFSQNSERENDGYNIFKYPNGTISSEGFLKDGKPEGFWTSYYVTGVKKSEGKRTNFLLDSVWVFYSSTGDTLEKINYLYGKKNGYYYKYSSDPVAGNYVSSRELYAGDKKEGVAYIYFPSGKIKQSIPYSSGDIDGLSKEYDIEGNIITLMEYNNNRMISRERINRVDNNGFKQGVWKEFYPSGTLKKEENYKDNVLHGYYQEYNNNGSVTITMLYENGSIVESTNDDPTEINIENKYDLNNKLIYSGPYRNDIPVGIHREYNEDGSIKKALIYNDNGVLISEGIVDETGNRNGSWKDFYEDGSLKAEGRYTNNMQTGTWKYYNTKGVVEQTGNYNNGRPDGTWKWYYESGELLREEDYYRGQRDGLYTEYSVTGEIIVQGEYTDGEKDKFWKYNSGDYIEEGNYIIGLKEGSWKSFYINGNQRFEGKYVQGNPDGIQRYYYESGSIKEEQYYKMGIRQKTWRKYYEDGTVILSITYRNDVETSINGIKIKLPENDVKLIN